MVPKNIPCVYFLWIPHKEGWADPHIKVGKAANYDKRLNDHNELWHGVKVAVEELCVVRGSERCESKIKDYFCTRDLQIYSGSRERFKPDEVIVSYIRWLRDQSYVWVPDDPKCPPMDQLPLMGADIWLPGDGKNKKRPKIRPKIFGDNHFGCLMLPPRTVMCDDYYTDPEITNAARKVMGGIDLDPASHAIANMEVGATKFYSEQEDGLLHDWGGRIWMNPPFTIWEDFAHKLLAELGTGRIEQVCALASTRTITAKYFQPLLNLFGAVCIMEGRASFWGTHASGPHGPTHGSVIFYYGNNVEKFKEEFSRFGAVYLNA